MHELSFRQPNPTGAIVVRNMKTLSATGPAPSWLLLGTEPGAVATGSKIDMTDDGKAKRLMV